MKDPCWARVPVALAIVLGIGACKAIPTKPVYRNPVISSVTAFPTLIGQGDSVLVTVVASDPDGDPLVYDWFTDGQLTIKDAWGVVYVYDTPSPSHVFYRSSGALYDSVASVTCEVRDLTGGGDGIRIHIRLRD